MSVIVAIQNTLLNLVYPPLCLACGIETDASNGLCPSCWSSTEFIYDTACTACGAPLLGEGEGLCEECFSSHPPWDDGTAVAVYGPITARIVTALKHGDRLEIVPRLGTWMATRTRDVTSPGAILIPIPVHWTRLVRRRYNQSELLAHVIARELGLTIQTQTLVRSRPTKQQRQMSREDRTKNQSDSFVVVDPARIEGKHVILVDDVMTTGATLRSAAETLQKSGVKAISISVFARVAPNL